MRKVIFGGANSLDNYIARSDQGVDWLLFSDEVAEIIGEFWKSVDTILMGRKTYEIAAASGPGESMPGMTSYVFSRTLKEVPAPAILVSENAEEVVRKLKSQPGKDICIMGGGDFAKTLFEADLIDVVGANIHPVLLGSGVPLFLPLSREIKLELNECRQLKNGCVYLTYNVKH